jgi:hypothetical protein
MVTFLDSDFTELKNSILLKMRKNNKSAKDQNLTKTDFFKESQKQIDWPTYDNLNLSFKNKLSRRF